VDRRGGARWPQLGKTVMAANLGAPGSSLRMGKTWESTAELLDKLARCRDNGGREIDGERRRAFRVRWGKTRERGARGEWLGFDPRRHRLRSYPLSFAVASPCRRSSRRGARGHGRDDSATKTMARLGWAALHCALTAQRASKPLLDSFSFSNSFLYFCLANS
jgi:hypothetical protein